MTDTRLRAVDPLIMELSGSKIVISSPRAGSRLRVGPAIAALLMAARTGIDPANHPEVTIKRLVGAGYLMDAAEPVVGPEPPWDDWGTTAWSFHGQTRNVPFITGKEPDSAAAYLDRISSRPRPPTIRRHASDRLLLLPRVRTPLSMPFKDVLEGRRTHRHFADHTLDLDAFSDLLHYSFAPLRFADAGEMGTLHLRASASGGARHETEAFVAVFNVRSVRPGLYHYDNIRHGLEPIRADVSRANLEHLTNNQGFFEQASFGVLTLAAAERMSWKYPHAVAYRLLLQNTGHVAQVFSMTAAALGFGAALTGAIRADEAEALMGARGPGEFVTFALACGLPVLRPDGLPKAICPPEVATEPL